jgi:sugar phosphate isomerase/epimerase
MIFGAITNSWRLQLQTTDLKDLVAKAEAYGARHIELRQTCLGDYETGEGDEWRPAVSRLRTLVDASPGLGFNLAMAWPCLTRKSDPLGDAFQAALEGAKAVGGSEPHLRLVDPASFEARWESPDDIPDEALAVSELAAEAARQGVVLSIENSWLPIDNMAMLVDMARDRMEPGESRYLGLCSDPINQLRGHPDTDPLEDLADVPPDVNKIVHFKQSRAGKPYHSVDTGDLDCGRMLDILEDQGFDGPAIMEIPSDANVFDNLKASFAFLSRQTL